MGLVKDEIPPSKLPEKSLSSRSKRSSFYILIIVWVAIRSMAMVAPFARTAEWLKFVADETNAEDMSLVQSFSPPLLNTQGRKTQPQWLLDWFKDISMIVLIFKLECQVLIILIKNGTRSFLIFSIKMVRI